MKTLEQFKQEKGIVKIEMMKTAKGREFAKIGDMTIIVASKFDDSKDAYVVEVSKDKDGNALENVFAICNSTVTKGRTF